MIFITLKNLKVNMEVKNYKELCKLLEEPLKENTNSRKAHIKTIEQYIKLKKNGRRFTIIEIYKTPILRIDKRNRYKSIAKYLLLHYLSANINETPNELLINRNMLYGVLGLPKTLCDRASLNELISNNIDFQQTSNSLISLFVLRVKDKVNTIIDSVLKDLQREKLITYENTLSIRIRNKQTIANKADIEQYKEIKKQVLNEMGYNDMFRIINNQNLYIIYYDKVNKYCKNKYDWDYVNEAIYIKPINTEIINKYNNIDYQIYRNMFINELRLYILSTLEKKRDNIFNHIDVETGEIKNNHFFISDTNIDNIKSLFKKIFKTDQIQYIY